MYQKHDVNENPRKTQKADITRKLAFWATKVALKATFLGLTTSLPCAPRCTLQLGGAQRRARGLVVFNNPELTLLPLPLVQGVMDGLKDFMAVRTEDCPPVILRDSSPVT